METENQVKAPLNDEEKARLAQLRTVAETSVLTEEGQQELAALIEREDIGEMITEGTPPADAPVAEATTESVPSESNSGTQPPNFDGTPQTAQPSEPQPNFNATVDAHVEEQTKVEPGPDGELPGGVTQTEDDGELILAISYDDEIGRYDFDGVKNAAAGERITVDDKASGAATVTVHVTGNAEDGSKYGYLTARIIGQSASRVYVFRKNVGGQDGTETIFTAKFTDHP